MPKESRILQHYGDDDTPKNAAPVDASQRDGAKSSVSRPNCSAEARDFKSLQSFVAGREEALARNLLGGTIPGESGSSLTCPRCKTEGLHFRPEDSKFVCEPCQWAGQLIQLIHEARGVSHNIASDMIREADANLCAGTVSGDGDLLIIPTAVSAGKDSPQTEGGQHTNVHADAIDVIVQGERNDSLYRQGLALRAADGLTGGALTAALHEINEGQCDPPLPADEVNSIAKNVDKSKKVPLGEQDTFRSRLKPKKKVSTPKRRTVYAISAADASVPVADLLSKQVSFYQDFWKKIPSGTTTIGKFLDDCRNGTYREQVEAVRAQANKDERDALKKGLPCITPHVNYAEGKTKEACEKAGRNGIASIDCDGIAESEQEAAKTKLAEIPGVFAVGTSVGGVGIFGLMAYEYEGTLDWDTLLTAVQAAFPDYTIDTNCKGIYRLRFASYDPTLIIKSGEIFPAILTSLEEEFDDAEVMGEIVRCNVEALDGILAKIEPVDWEPFQIVGRGGEVKPPSEKVYLLRTVERVLQTADTEGMPIVNQDGNIYYFAETHYKPIRGIELTSFLIEAARLCGVPSDTAVYQTFAEKIVRQFMINSTRYGSGTVEPDVPYVSLKNGVLSFYGKERRFEEHSPQRFIRYCLNFDYDPEATAPRWQKHLDRTLPSREKQQYVAKCLALPFYPGKIEKAIVFYGERDTGKSTTLDVVKALFGAENCSAESLAALTKDDNQGAYARARLDGRLVNIASDISKKLNDEGIAKRLISREAVSARHPYGRGFDITNYARLFFAMNDLAPQFFSDAALTKRTAIVHFDQQIRPEDIDTSFTENIIDGELPGVLNWILDGLDHLLETGRLDPPQCCAEEVEQLRKELDPLSIWLDRRNYQRGETFYVSVSMAHLDFVDFCKKKRYMELSDRTFTKRLRELGYAVERENGRVGTVLRYTKSDSDLYSPRSPHSPPLENKDESVEQAGNGVEQTGSDQTACQVSIPAHSPLVPASEPTNPGLGNEGNEGNGNSEHISCGENEPPPLKYIGGRRTVRISELLRSAKRVPKKDASPDTAVVESVE